MGDKTGEAMRRWRRTRRGEARRAGTCEMMLSQKGQDKARQAATRGEKMRRGAKELQGGIETNEMGQDRSRQEEAGRGQITQGKIG
jgi:hypothetical protein